MKYFKLKNTIDYNYIQRSIPDIVDFCN